MKNTILDRAVELYDRSFEREAYTKGATELKEIACNAFCSITCKTIFDRYGNNCPSKVVCKSYNKFNQVIEKQIDNLYYDTI